MARRCPRTTSARSSSRTSRPTSTPAASGSSTSSPRARPARSSSGRSPSRSERAATPATGRYGRDVSEGVRRFAAPILVVVASVAIVLALLVGYARRAVVDSNQFANRATAVLDDPAARTLIAERVTDQLVLKHRSDLTAARPLIESIVSG